MRFQVTLPDTAATSDLLDSLFAMYPSLLEEDCDRDIGNDLAVYTISDSAKNMETLCIAMRLLALHEVTEYS